MYRNSHEILNLFDIWKSFMSWREVSVLIRWGLIVQDFLKGYFFWPQGKIKKFLLRFFENTYVHLLCYKFWKYSTSTYSDEGKILRWFGNVTTTQHDEVVRRDRDCRETLLAFTHHFATLRCCVVATFPGSQILSLITWILYCFSLLDFKQIFDWNISFISKFSIS